MILLTAGWPMRRLRTWLLGLGILTGAAAGLGLPGSGTARAADTDDPRSARPARWTSAQLPLNEMAPAVRDRVRFVVDNPALASQGPLETFRCDPRVYQFYLDHPDRAVAAWRLLGARVVDIAERSPGRFGWSDGDDSDVTWVTAYQNDQMRIWYARGLVKPGHLVPLVPFEAVMLLRHAVGQDATGRPLVRHQVDLMVHTDSRGAQVVAKVLGTAAPRLAEQYLGQVEMFFSALSGYIADHPDRADELLAAAPLPPVLPRSALADGAEPRRGLGLLRRNTASPRTPANPVLPAGLTIPQQ